jgi:hypothetical protein
MTREGVRCFEDVRRRFDGERRNPWDELECGHHYARAMSAWSGLLATSGFRYRGPEQAVVAVPRSSNDRFTSFWSAGTAWGLFTRSTGARTRLTLSVFAGKLPCRSVELDSRSVSERSSASIGQRNVAHQLNRRDGRAVFNFSEPVELIEGDQLVLEL